MYVYTRAETNYRAGKIKLFPHFRSRNHIENT